MSQAKYLGVDKDAVIQSLKEGEAFIRNLDLGPATRSVLDDFNIAVVDKTLTSAKTDKQLAQAMRETGAAHIFSRMSELFNHCAARDLDGQAHDVYQSLAKWGAFAGFNTADYRDTDYEMHLYLVTDYVRVLREMPQMDIKSELAPLFTQWDVQYAGECENIEKLCDKLITFTDAKDADWQADLETAFAAMTLRERYQTMEMAATMIDMESRLHMVKQDWPLKQFGIKIESETNDFQEMQTILAPIMDKVNEVLTPYYELDEVDMTGVGAITRDFKNSGFVLVTSARVAQELANALPDWNVIDGAGKRIEPVTNKTAPTPKP